ncbi:MAG: 16S rRNA (cytosine(967)-C(5))-methyltransferase RsmB [Planctomycetes bacterium]|nr:16S rRNA (cytosine(967)-C(5))-methyltransferase RsmB [Planctomycetota bacterium]
MVSARAAALRALTALDRGRCDRIREGLDAARLQGREQAFAYELAHGVLRRERLLDFVLLGLAHRGLPRDPLLRAALRLGAYQLLFVAGMPARAAVHETVALLRRNGGFANALLRALAGRIEARPAAPAAATTELPLGPERTLLLPTPLPADEVQRLAIVHSLPDFAARAWAEAHGLAGLRQIAAAASAVPGVFLRPVAPLAVEGLQAELAAAGVVCAPAAHPRLLRWAGGESPFATDVFRRGACVVQDPTAFAVVEAVPCGPGQTVVDLCAAPGTKTLGLAERVGPGGRVVAFDVDPVRRRRIVENVARCGFADRVQVVEAPSALPTADAVLADVPCSNTGVLGRRVEVRRRLQPDTATGLAGLQRGLLVQAIRLVRPGGAVVYSTCSIEPAENDAVVDAVLSLPDLPACRLVHRQLTLPQAGACDGGFFAVLARGLPAPPGDG